MSVATVTEQIVICLGYIAAGQRVNNVEFSAKANNKASGSEFRLKVHSPISMRGEQIALSLIDAETATNLAGWKKAFEYA